MSIRDKIRSAVLDAKPLTQTAVLFGETVEIRQPTLEVVMSARERTPQEQTVMFLIDYTFVPGTDEKVFEPADAEALVKVPFGSDMKAFIDKVNTLLGVDAKEVDEQVDKAMKKD